LISQIDISYNGQFTTEYYAYPDTTLLIFPASDVNLTNLTSDKNEALKGEKINVTVYAQNTGMAVNNVRLLVYAIMGNDSVKIGEKFYPQLLANER